MRKILIATAVGASMGAAMLAYAASPADNRLEGRAYVHFNFGGDRSLPSNFHYGMRLDYDQRYLTMPMPSILQMDFKDSGFNVARLNGLPVVRRIALNQAEGIAVGAAAASSVTVIDWALVAVGVAGVGVATAAAIENSDEGTIAVGGGTTGSTTGGGTTGSTTGSTTGGETTGSTTGSTTGGETTGSTTGSTTGGETTGGSTTGGSTTGGSTTGGSTTGIPLLGLSQLDGLSVNSERNTPEYQEWLDGGNGQMGDLSTSR